MAHNPFMMFLIDPKKTLTDDIRYGIACYVERFKIPPNCVIVHDTIEAQTVDHVRVCHAETGEVTTPNASIFFVGIRP